MNQCEHGHETTGEIRALPLGGDPDQGSMHLCRRCHTKELAFREERARTTGREKWDFPSWESLRVVSGGLFV
jgi:hypothetical protein